VPCSFYRKLLGQAGKAAFSKSEEKADRSGEHWRCFQEDTVKSTAVMNDIIVTFIRLLKIIPLYVFQGLLVPRKQNFEIASLESGVVVHTRNPSTGQPGDTVRPCLKKTKQKT
jgi:hypothetical protein